MIGMSHGDCFLEYVRRVYERTMAIFCRKGADIRKTVFDTFRLTCWREQRALAHLFNPWQNQIGPEQGRAEWHSAKDTTFT